jgi:hypothetical protein
LTSRPGPQPTLASVVRARRVTAGGLMGVLQL